MKRIILLYLLSPLSLLCMERAHRLDKYICTVDKDPCAKYHTLLKRTGSKDPINYTMDVPNAGIMTENQKFLDMIESQKFLKELNQRREELLKWQDDPLFNPKFLANSTRTRQHLIENEGFAPVDFTTEDNVKIGGVLKERKNARYNVIATAGLFPGRKEGIATLYKVLPDDCNLLLFDARGHGDSDGHMWRDILWNKCHAKNEPFDVLAALQYMNKKYPDLSNVMYGTCSGAYHTTNALLIAEERKIVKEHKVKAFISDSSWDEMIPTGYRVAGEHLTGLVGGSMYYGASALYQTWMKGSYKPIEEARDLPNRIQQFPSSVKPIFIHATNDMDVPI